MKKYQFLVTILLIFLVLVLILNNKGQTELINLIISYICAFWLMHDRENRP